MSSLRFFPQDGIDACHGGDRPLVFVDDSAHKHDGTAHADQERVERHESTQRNRAVDDAQTS